MANRPEPKFDEFVEWVGYRRLSYVDSSYLYQNFPLDHEDDRSSETLGRFISKAVSLGLYVKVCWGNASSDYVEGVLVCVSVDKW